ncbi:MAG: family 20 glycosylhydrolase [Clostridia bacterium]|nr:family 20 glycosylhydrolase [Clostridia bacterium]
MYIIPNPQKWEIKDEKIDIKSVYVEGNCDCIYKFAGLLNEDTKGVKISFRKTDELCGEHYKIEIDTNGITVMHGTAEGAYRATSTLKQILAQREDGKINCMSIDDYPDIPNRGYMLDISRGRIPNLSHIKTMVDILADLKYNQLQLYMETFVYEYKNFTEYTKDTEPLTQAEIKELDAYCKEHFITLVPNQNSFGHMAAWTSQKELSHLAITDEDGKPSATLNPLLDETMEFIDKVYDGYFDAFSSDMVNIGMDETFDLGLNETKEACEKYGTGKVYTDYLVKVCKLISEKYGKTPMFWDDIVFKHPEQIENVPENAIFMDWGYETIEHFDRNCQRLKERGFRYYLCPGTSMWKSYTGRCDNMIINIASSAECAKYYDAEGFLLTEWGDGGHPQFPATAMFPAVFGGAMSWKAGLGHPETAFDYRRELIGECKQYTDKYIYGCTGEKSLADIVYRMGNYYLLEHAPLHNGTELDMYMEEEEIPEEKVRAFKNVKRYMTELRDELSEVTADETAIREIKVNCDMVIFIASKLIGDNLDYKNEFEALKAEFEELWMMKNHRAGINICMDKLEKAIL